MAGSQQIDFYDSGYSYSQDGGGFSYPQDQSANYGEYYGDYEQTYNGAPGYGNQPQNIMNPQPTTYGFNEQMRQGGSGDYASFEDEPPLLEGLYFCAFNNYILKN